MTKTQQIKNIIPSLEGLTCKEADEKLGSLAEIHGGGCVMMNCGGRAWKFTGIKVEIGRGADGKWRVLSV